VWPNVSRVVPPLVTNTHLIMIASPANVGNQSVSVNGGTNTNGQQGSYRRSLAGFYPGNVWKVGGGLTGSYLPKPGIYRQDEIRDS